MDDAIRPATHDDVPAMMRVAAAGGSPDADDAHFGFVARVGRLLVAVDGEAVVGVAGAVPTPDAWMITDLFVDEGHRGAGIGGRLLATATAGADRIMTCSSTHPGALAAYARLGLVPRCRLLTLRGTAVGGGPPLTAASWRHERVELVDYFRSRGGVVTEDAVLLSDRPDGVHVVARLVAGELDAATAILRSILAALPTGATVELSVPEADPFAAAARTLGFEVLDEDIVCSTPGVDVTGRARCVHRGLF